MAKRRIFPALAIAVSAFIACSSRPAGTPETGAPEPSASALRPASGIQPKRGCRERFAALDTNGDGLVSVDEFLVRPHECEEPEQVFSLRDGNRDGSLTESEFCSDARLCTRPRRPMRANVTSAR